jgi:chemosensory pili system protein ChpA (sensor histidine kinase/response regulator)
MQRGFGGAPMAAASILIVDDERDTRDAIALAFEQLGYAVTTAVDGQDAWNRLQAGLRPAVIVLDLHMPVKSGTHFRTQLLAYPELAAIPIVGCSADPFTREKAVALGFADAFMKPFDMDVLVDAVVRLATARDVASDARARP